MHVYTKNDVLKIVFTKLANIDFSVMFVNIFTK